MPTGTNQNTYGLKLHEVFIFFQVLQWQQEDLHHDNTDAVSARQTEEWFQWDLNSLRFLMVSLLLMIRKTEFIVYADMYVMYIFHSDWIIVNRENGGKRITILSILWRWWSSFIKLLQLCFKRMAYLPRCFSLGFFFKKRKKLMQTLFSPLWCDFYFSASRI